MERPQNSKLFELAQSAAFAAGEVLVEKRRTGFSVSKKGRVNLVTEADLVAEGIIVDRVLGQYPDHQILAEEGAQSSGTTAVKWVIDPLDGTTNYAHGYPFYCVSIGVEVDGVVVVGVVYDPVAEECFSAIKGEGARLNGAPIQVSTETSLVDSLVSTGFSYGDSEIRNNLTLFNAMMLQARSVRRDGSAALDLSYVACGRFEAFWELCLNPWDVAAGALIVEEAGGRVTRFDGVPATIYDRECLATNTGVHEEMVRLLTESRRR